MIIIINVYSNFWALNSTCIHLFIVNQPIPPIVKCSNGNCAKTQAGQAGFLASRGELLAPDQDFPDSKQTKEDLRKFCLFRDSGEYPLPANCDFFIYCTHGQGIFAFCPNGTKFNPVFLTCDYPVNHECKFDSRKFWRFFRFGLCIKSLGK